MSRHKVSVWVYFRVFAALLTLTGLTVFVAFLDLGPLNTPAAIVIACVKALLVVLFFMHVRYSEPLIGLFLAVGFTWVLLLMGGTLLDMDERDESQRAFTSSWIVHPESFIMDEHAQE